MEKVNPIIKMEIFNIKVNGKKKNVTEMVNPFMPKTVDYNTSENGKKMKLKVLEDYTTIQRIII